MDFPMSMGPNDLALVRLYREIIEEGETWHVEFQPASPMIPPEAFHAIRAALVVLDDAYSRGQVVTRVPIPREIQEPLQAHCEEV